MKKNKLLYIWGVVIIIAIGVFAYFYPLEQVEAPSPATYDQNSRKSLIPADCHSFFDGCNSCFRTEDGEAACTRMFCESYQEPRCTDQDNQQKSSEFVSSCDESDPLSQCEITESIENSEH